MSVTLFATNFGKTKFCRVSFGSSMFCDRLIARHIALDRDLAAQQTDTEGRYFDERLRERESARKAAAARSSMEFERTRQYETDY